MLNKLQPIRGIYFIYSPFQPDLYSVLGLQCHTNIQHWIVFTLGHAIDARVVIDTRRQVIHGRQYFKVSHKQREQRLQLIHGVFLGCEIEFNVIATGLQLQV